MIHAQLSLPLSPPLIAPPGGYRGVSHATGEVLLVAPTLQALAAQAREQPAAWWKAHDSVHCVREEARDLLARLKEQEAS